MQIIFNIFWQRPAALFFFALRWILMSDAVTCTIPGAKRPAQVEENVRAADLQPLPDAMMTKFARCTTVLFVRRCIITGEFSPLEVAL